jgi:hypothetical protein
MSENNEPTKTKTLFESLNRLYKQSQLLLMDADRLLGERGWEPTNTTAPSGFSYSLNTPERWYARWVVRFYAPVTSPGEDSAFDQIIFVSIHFASDLNASLPTEIDEPIISAGRIKYKKPMTAKIANKNYDYYMCKYWFFGKPHETLEGWRKTTGSKYSENLEGSETFIVPLYIVTSSDKLKEMVIEPLLAIALEERNKEV